MEKIGWQVEKIGSYCSSEARYRTVPGAVENYSRKTSRLSLSRACREARRIKKRSLCKIFIKKLPILPFSIIKILRYKPPIQLSKLEEICKKYRPILIKLEPFEVEKIKNGQVYFKVFKSNKSPLVPTKTLWINLTKPEKQLLSEMKQKTRYNLRKAEKYLLFEPCLPARLPDGQAGRLVENSTKKTSRLSLSRACREARRVNVKIVSGDKVSKNQLQSFYNLWSKNKPFNWLFKPHFNELKYLVESFGKRCFFVFIYKKSPHCHSELDSESIQIKFTTIDSGSCFQPVRNDRGYQLLASCLILTSKNIAFYWHNASTKTGKRNFAPTLCVWKAIKEAKKRGLKIFDFEGLWDERFPHLNKGWKGFTRFKKGFSFKARL